MTDEPVLREPRRRPGGVYRRVELQPSFPSLTLRALTFRRRGRVDDGLPHRSFA